MSDVLIEARYVKSGSDECMAISESFCNSYQPRPESIGIQAAFYDTINVGDSTKSILAGSLTVYCDGAGECVLYSNKESIGTKSVVSLFNSLGEGEDLGVPTFSGPVYFKKKSQKRYISFSQYLENKGINIDGSEFEKRKPKRVNRKVKSYYLARNGIKKKS